MKKILFGLSCLLCLSPVLAALPPQFQRAAELQAILSSEAVELLGQQGQLVDAIEYISPDLYRVSGGNCVLFVRIVDVPPAETGEAPMVGPRQFTLDIQEPFCG